MDLEKCFSAKADNDGIFRAIVSFSDTNLKNEFRGILRLACDETGVICGLNDKPDFFEIGFQSADDSKAVMDFVTSTLADRSEALKIRYEQDQKAREYKDQQAIEILKRAGYTEANWQNNLG